MLQRYKMISIVYGGSGAKYAEDLNQRIARLSDESRYPLSSIIVMESILTGDLLANVVKLFETSEVCVAFLTAEDCCIHNGRESLRLRQNVVFELGMAIFRLGRERCILLSDFDPNDSRFELPSDLGGIDIKFFCQENKEQVFQDVLDKILQLSRTSILSGHESEQVPCYDHLLDREDYYVDYETLFFGSEKLLTQEGSAYLKGILELWKEECGSFQHFEERCMYFLERIGFLTIFGRHTWVCDWCDACEKMLSRFKQSDIAYCGIRKLKFVQNLANAVSKYTKLKLDPYREPLQEDYEEVLNQLMLEPYGGSSVTNPLAALIYYDYLGLTCLKLYDYTAEKEYLLQAVNSFQQIMDCYVDHVDMSLSIWTGFVAYNLARCYMKLYSLTGEIESGHRAQELLNQATFVRKKWLSIAGVNQTIRSALSFEYFICKMEQIAASGFFEKRSSNLLRQDYKRLEGELEAYLSKNEQLERLRFVQKMIDQRQTELF